MIVTAGPPHALGVAASARRGPGHVANATVPSTKAWDPGFGQHGGWYVAL